MKSSAKSEAVGQPSETTFTPETTDPFQGSLGSGRLDQPFVPT